VLVEAEQHDRMTSGAVQFVTPKASLETLKSKTEMPSAADVLRTLEKQKYYVDTSSSTQTTPSNTQSTNNSQNSTNNNSSNQLYPAVIKAVIDGASDGNAASELVLSAMGG
jgi:hypothetical protein